MEMAFGIIGALTGLSGIIISLFSFYHNRIEAVNAFYANFRNPVFIEARKTIHNLPSNYVPEEILREHGDKIAYIVLSYEQAGILAKKHKLPFWLFTDHSTGIAIVRLYEKLQPYILFRREYDNVAYGKQFEYLVERIKRKRPPEYFKLNS